MFHFSLFAIVFLNLLCVGANFPALPSYNEQFGAEEFALTMLYIAFGLSRAIVSPFWGQLSDRIGRKPVMIGSLATIAGSIIWINSTTWWMLMGSRLVDGLLSAQAVVAAAMITDFVEPKNRTAMFGLIGAAVSLGLTLGPIWGGIVTESFSPAAVGYGFLILQGLALCVILFFLPETLQKSARSTVTFSFAETLAPLGIRSAQPFYLLTFMGSVIFGTLTIAIPMRTLDLLNWSTLNVSYAFAAIGLVSAVVQGGALRGLLKITQEKSLIYCGLILMIAGNLLPALFFNTPNIYLGIVITTIGGSLALPCIKGLLSKTTESNAGTVMGYNQALQNLGRSVGPVLGPIGLLLLPNGEFMLPALFTMIPLILALKMLPQSKTPF